MDAQLVAIPLWDEVPGESEVPPGTRQAVNAKAMDAIQGNAGWGWALFYLNEIESDLASLFSRQVFTVSRDGLNFPDVGGPVGKRYIGGSTAEAYYFENGADGILRIGSALVVRTDVEVVVPFSSPGTDDTDTASMSLRYEVHEPGDVPGSNIVSGASLQPADVSVANEITTANFAISLDSADVGKRLWIEVQFNGTDSGWTLASLDVPRLEVR